MSRMIKFLAIAIILFSLAASASWYLQYEQAKDAENAKTGDEKSTKAQSAKHSKKDGTSPPPIVRQATSQDGDRISRMIDDVQKREERNKLHEQKLIVRQNQINLLHEEL